MENINVLKYSQSQNVNAYETILKHLQPKSEFSGLTADIMQMSYSNVKYAMKLMSKLNSWDELFEIYELVFKCSREQFNKATVVEYYHARRYIIDTFKVINENEKKLAEGGSIDLTKWEQSGGNRLNQFDDFVGLDPLAERYGIYPFDLGRKPYSEVFYLQAMVKTVNEVNYNYSKQ